MSWGTMGILRINGKFECYTLEDIVRKEKIKGDTAIPVGVYNVAWTMSNRFKVMMPLVEKVPGFEGIRIHAGNTTADTEGCILVGLGRSLDTKTVTMSRVAIASVNRRIETAIKAGEKVTLTIEGE